MPIYEYVCGSCKKKTEVIQGMNDPRLKVCPHCGGKLTKQFSAPAIQFKGSGFYITDYPKGESGSRKSEGGKSESGGSSEKSEKTEKSEKSEKSEKAESAGKSEKVEKRGGEDGEEEGKEGEGLTGDAPHPVPLPPGEGDRKPPRVISGPSPPEGGRGQGEGGYPSLSPFKYSRNAPPRSFLFNANSTVAFRNPSLSPAS